eukprot:c2939_g1_i1.p1 GENE.c2939_g1_i1~~c2939_g1_i1.p1  ORF type:complete len:190 (+),score=35.34 c2939_g1_i1:38-607(+)
MRQGRDPNGVASILMKHLRSKTKVQKGLYHLQAAYFNLTGEMLMQGYMMHWDHGPVFPEVWKKQREVIYECSAQQEPELVVSLCTALASELELHTASNLSKDSHDPNGPWAHTAKNHKITEDKLMLYPATEIETKFLMLVDDILRSHIWKTAKHSKWPNTETHKLIDCEFVEEHEYISSVTSDAKQATD